MAALSCTFNIAFVVVVINCFVIICALATENSVVGATVSQHDQLRPLDKKKVKIGVITWNMAERSPNLNDCEFLNQYKDCDFLALGLQECEDIRPRRTEGRRSKKWRQLRSSILHKESFTCIGEKKMGGLHLSLYSRRHCLSLVKGFQSVEIPCGVGNVLTNKGAICIALRLKNKKTVAFINAHLAAHQNMVKVRNANYQRIMQIFQEKLNPNWQKSQGVRIVRKGKRSAVSSQKITKKRKITTPRTENVQQFFDPKLLTEQATKHFQTLTGTSTTPTLPCKDVVDMGFFFGDLNYRMEMPMLQIETFCNAFGYPANSDESKDLEELSDILTSENEEEAAAKENMNYSLNFDVLKEESTLLNSYLAIVLKYDQLIREMRRERAFVGFKEMAIQFPPTFKYDKRSPTFDSKKGRCPAWTDRILFFGPQRLDASVQTTNDVLQPLTYECYDVRSSDHRPVGATFEYELDDETSKLLSQAEQERATAEDDEDADSSSETKRKTKRRRILKKPLTEKINRMRSKQ